MLNQMKIGMLFLYFSFSSVVYGQSQHMKASVPSFPPFYFVDAKNICKGVAVDVLAKLTAEALIELSVVTYPYPRILHTLKTGQLDAALIFKNTAIADNVDYLGPVSKSQVIILTTPKYKITRYQDLAQLTAIAVIRHASFENRFDKDLHLNKFEIANYEQGLQMLKLGRVDAIIGSLVGLEYASNKLNIPFNKQHAFLLGEKEWWLHLSKKSPFQQFKPQLNKAIKNIYQHDLIHKTYQQYISSCQ